MSTIQQEIEIASDAEQVWTAAGDPARISEWLPAIETSRVEGDRRSCTLADGGRIEERILEHSNSGRRYRYEILDGPMPVNSYVSTFEVEDHGEHAHVTWAAEFEPDDPAQRDELVETFTQIYSAGLGSLKAKVENGG